VVRLNVRPIGDLQLSYEKMGVIRTRTVEMNKRPISVTIIAGVYLLVGTVAFVYYFRQILASPALRSHDALIELTELIAIVSGVALLRRHDWARWLTASWMAFHVAISFGSLQKLVVHSLFLVVISYFLFFRADARAYFEHKER
jgi:hypothetical protein